MYRDFRRGYPPAPEESSRHADHPQHHGMMMQQDPHHHHHHPQYYVPPEFHSSAPPPPYPPPPFSYPPPPFPYPPAPYKVDSFPPPPHPAAPRRVSSYGSHLTDTTPPPPFNASYPPPDGLSSYGSHLTETTPPPPFNASYPPPDSLPSNYSLRERSNPPLEHAHSHNVIPYPPVLYRTPSLQEHSPESSVTGLPRSASDNNSRKFPEVTLRESSPPTSVTSREFPEVTSRESSPPMSVNPHREVELPRGQLVRVFCKSNRSYNLSVKDNRLMMVKADTLNESQQWVRDGRFALRVKDSYGHPAFMLINKVSKKVLRHAKSKLQEVQMVDYEPGMEDEDLLWTESQDFGEGFKTLRMANNTLLNMTVGSSTIKEGSPIILDTWHKKDHQLWKIFPL